MLFPVRFIMHKGSDKCNPFSFRNVRKVSPVTHLKNCGVERLGVGGLLPVSRLPDAVTRHWSCLDEGCIAWSSLRGVRESENGKRYENNESRCFVTTQLRQEDQ